MKREEKIEKKSDRFDRKKIWNRKRM